MLGVLRWRSQRSAMTRPATLHTALLVASVKTGEAREEIMGMNPQALP